MHNRILLSLLMVVSMPAIGVNKCEAQGRVTYTDIPCGTLQPGTTQTMLPSPPHSTDADAAAARQQATSDKRQLAAIEKNRSAERAASVREQGRHKPDKSALAHKKKCTLLGLEKKWSAEDADAISSTVSARSQGLKKTARRKAERYETECEPGR